MDGDGLINREDLALLYTAYFRLTMQLIRDVVRGWPFFIPSSLPPSLPPPW